MRENVKCSILGSKNPQYSYTMGGHAPAGTVLEAVEEEKDVGVIVSSSLKPTSQCVKAAKKANQVLGQMARAFHYRDKITWIRLYKTYVRCHLEYAVQAWNPWLQKDKELLEAVQRRAVRMVSGLEGKDYEDRLKEVGLTTLEARRERGDMIETWKILTGKENVNPASWFQMANEGEQITRQASHPLNIYRPQWARLDMRTNFYSARVCQKWNSLPNYIKDSKTIETFKNSYDNYMNE